MPNFLQFMQGLQEFIPCVYVLLPNKTKATYAWLFPELLNINGNLRPASVLIDFKLGIKNAFEAVSPEVPVKGCFFHFTQNIWKKIQENGLQMRYQQDPTFVTEATMIAALAFVPGADANRVFNTLSNNNDQALDVILDYIEDNYIGIFRRGHFRHVRFPYEMWGVHDRVGCHHAIIWKLIGVLKEDKDISRVNLLHIQQLRNPLNPNPVLMPV